MNRKRGGVDVFDHRRVHLPHEYVLSGVNKERISYDQLSATQWMTDFCRKVAEEKKITMREHTLDYLIALLEDANDFS